MAQQAVVAPPAPTAAPVQQASVIAKDKQRAQQYEADLNKARDEIQVAQKTMQSIDTQVADFHQKMAKSMHSLLKAFTEGFAAMDKAKEDQILLD